MALIISSVSRTPVVATIISNDFVFLDGGHSYETVKDDLNILTSKLKKNSIILCDDYNISHYGVKKAVDEIKDNFLFKDLGRFAFLRIYK